MGGGRKGRGEGRGNKGREGERSKIIILNIRRNPTNHFLLNYVKPYHSTEHLECHIILRDIAPTSSTLSQLQRTATC